MTDLSAENQWSEENSRQFLQFAGVVFPYRTEQNAIVASLIPADHDETFVVVDLGCGTGPLSRAVLERFPSSYVIGLDGSRLMLRQAQRELADFRDRFETQPFDLFQRDWLGRLPGDIRCFVSSLAIHHLDGSEKQRLYGDLATHIEPGGALFIQDLVEPATQQAWQLNARMWDAYVKHQSVRATGSLEMYETFVADGWNHFATPDVEFDKPSGLFEQLRWLEQAGLTGADCFWLWYGHAVFGAFKPSA